MNRNTLRHVIAGAAVALATAGTVGCTDTSGTVSTTGYVYDDAYLYTTYYPADVAYASYYYAYPWDYSTFYYYLNAYGPGPTGNQPADAGTSGTAGTSGDAGTSNLAHSGLAFAIESLARGQQVCPGQVTVTEKTATFACQGASGTAQQRAGALIAFDNCTVSGSTINGTVEVMGTATASDPTCAASTTITLNHTTTITNLSIKVADGRTLLIPNQTDTGMTTFTFGQSPATTDIKSNGELKIMDSSGTTQADLSFMTDNAFTFSGTQSYKLDGTTTVQEKNGNATATITRQGLVRSQGCCRPTGGTITVDRTGGTLPGRANWSFGPSCGQVMREGASVTMPTCM
jgi:hypothetical protein